ncbi:MAG: DUF3887 domain-containing protein [Cyanobacteriota bacterium]|jgi:hypothetical protein|nr:DUF3887 domain-containing protein [Cyanobacteriota bacterium]
MSAPSLLDRLRTAAAGSLTRGLGLGLALGMPVGPLQLSQALAQPLPASAAIPEVSGQSSSALSEERARLAANRILEALRSGTATSRYAQFAPSLQRMTSPELVQSQIRRMPRLLSWRLGTIQPGVDSSLVEATLETSAGQRQLTMVMDADGKLEAYHFDVADRPAEDVARRFVQALIEGRFLTASGLLSAETQLEIPASTLQAKWQNLQRYTGTVQGIQKVLRAESTTEQKLVLVTTRFNRLTDSLFIIMDGANQIIGVDFPTDQAGGSKTSTPR